MARLITQEELRTVIEQGDGYIQSGDKNNAEGLKYDFTFSGRFLKAVHGRELKVSDFAPSDSRSIRVDPGETVFVLTQEYLKLPVNIKAELSHKRKLAHDGVIILGGFCVDPLYEGNLMFGIYNISSEPFPLVQGKKLIAAQFYQLDEIETAAFPKPGSIVDFPRDVTGIIGRFKGASNEALKTEVEKLAIQMHELRDVIEKREGWLEDFKENLEKIEDLLERERQERLAGQSDVSKILQEQTKNLEKLNTSSADLEKAIERHKVMLGMAKWFVLIILGFMVLYFLKSVFGDKKKTAWHVAPTVEEMIHPTFHGTAQGAFVPRVTPRGFLEPLGFREGNQHFLQETELRQLAELTRGRSVPTRKVVRISPQSDLSGNLLS
jgi:deoxycytidine triphosphate deaminase